MKKLLPKLLALVLVLAGAVLYYVFDHRPAGPDVPVDNPGRVSTDIPSDVASLMEVPDLTDSYSPIVPHKAYVSSYNEETLIPDWVAYELTADETGGTESRGGIEFRMDPTLRGVTQAMREDYSGSGWTKGHLMPAADAAYSTTTMGETFYFTNICPQDETLNAGDWAYLEKRVRQWANRYGTIGEREVVVPDSFFKALLIQKKNGSYSAIAFVMDNDDERYYLKDCYLTVDELETLTGFNFFPQLDDTIEEKVESKVRLSDWGIR